MSTPIAILLTIAIVWIVLAVAYIVWLFGWLYWKRFRGEI